MKSDDHFERGFSHEEHYFFKIDSEIQFIKQTAVTLFLYSLLVIVKSSSIIQINLIILG
jgi:hypothetical protein